MNLLQKDVAKLFNVCKDSIIGWETNRGEPQIRYYPKLIEFLGYFPFDIDKSTFGEK